MFRACFCWIESPRVYLTTTKKNKKNKKSKYTVCTNADGKMVGYYRNTLWYRNDPLILLVYLDFLSRLRWKDLVEIFRWKYFDWDLSIDLLFRENRVWNNGQYQGVQYQRGVTVLCAFQSLTSIFFGGFSPGIVISPVTSLKTCRRNWKKHTKQ